MRKNAIYLIAMIYILEILSVTRGLPHPSHDDSVEVEKDALGLPTTKGGNGFETFEHMKVRVPYSSGGNRMYTPEDVKGLNVFDLPYPQLKIKDYGDADEVATDHDDSNDDFDEVEKDELGLPKHVNKVLSGNGFKAVSEVKDHANSDEGANGVDVFDLPYPQLTIKDYGDEDEVSTDFPEDFTQGASGLKAVNDVRVSHGPYQANKNIVTRGSVTKNDYTKNHDTIQLAVL